MVSIRFSSFVLGILFIFLALRDSVAYNHKAKEEMIMVVTDGNAFMAIGHSPSTLEKENIYAVPSAVVEVNNGKLGGRKMMEKVVLGKEMVKREEGMKIREAPKISGRNMNVPKPHGTSQGHMHHQNDASLLKPKQLGSKRLGNSVKESVDLHKPNTLCSQDSEADTSKDRSACSMPKVSKELIDSFQNLQSQKLLDETSSGIVNLMNRDYPGAGNPPHNNYELLHQQKEIP
ncbi:uncharacterized protein LOC114309032 [Camellia sinensis]|uniref:Uncharacterized protein n=1 Tax=Camellia sinensis var. sinensis TaxID=542762 RepID=A0A4V3WLG3_CAMSN|nr:uncharacterized protein LOC114309032 [Camellia sinensis]THG04657.1 hypothetical protein TEA_004786 [Camellia sinensis var. sinensis]